MTSSERFSIVMDILDSNNLCNNTRNHIIFERLNNNDLFDSAKVKALIEKIRAYEIREEEKPNIYAEHIMQYLRQRRGLCQFDLSEDSEIERLTKNEVFDEVCNWHGLVNFSWAIKSWINDIYGIDLSEIE